MLNKITEIVNFFDLGDLRYYFLIAKKNIKNLLLVSTLIALAVYFVSLNVEKKYLSKATIVIAPDENKIVNIEEVYSLESMQNRVNNQIAILKSEEVIDYIVEDEKNELEQNINSLSDNLEESKRAETILSTYKIKNESQLHKTRRCCCRSP